MDDNNTETTPPFWRIERDRDADSVPLIATAIHDGHTVSENAAAHLALDEAGRLREEDPFSAVWTAVAPTRILGLHSRFELDLNRPREKAVYRVPADAWGLTVWKDAAGPPDAVLQNSLAGYDAFYAEVRTLFEEAAARHGRFVVYDLHTYNHRRGGPDAPPDDPEANPEVIVGTGTMRDRSRWAAVIDRFVGDLSAFEFPGRGALDIRENVKFRGGQFARWTHENFPESACVLSIEFQKFFMDEWTGEPDTALVEAIRAALATTVPGVLEALRG
jgi:N-formylglutamate amidohydrolase